MIRLFYRMFLRSGCARSGLHIASLFLVLRTFMIRVFTGAVAAGARFDAGFNEGLRTAIIYAALVNAKTLHPSYSFVDGIITNNPERVAAKLQTVPDPDDLKSP